MDAAKSALRRAPCANDATLAENAISNLESHGCSCLVPDRSGYTSLHYAAAAAAVDVVRLLLLHRADPNELNGNRGFQLDEVYYHELKTHKPERWFASLK